MPLIGPQTRRKLRASNGRIPCLARKSDTQRQVAPKVAREVGVATGRFSGKRDAEERAYLSRMCFVVQRHHQGRFASLIQAAEPAGVKRRTALLFFVEASIFPDLHRIAAARARIAVAGNDDALLSRPLVLQFASP